MGAVVVLAIMGVVFLIVGVVCVVRKRRQHTVNKPATFGEWFVLVTMVTVDQPC